MFDEENEVTEVKELLAFTLKDAEEEKNACSICRYRPTCPIILFVNKLSIKRDGKVAEDEFSCSIFKSETD